MSEQKRTPGRVDEEAAPLDRSESVSKEHANNKGSANASAEIHRVPGQVDGPSEPITEDVATSLTDYTLGPGSASRSPWKYVFILFAISILIWLCYQVGSAIAAIWMISIWYGLPLALIGGLFLVMLVFVIVREYRALHTIDALQDRRERISAVLVSENVDELREILEPTLKNLRKRYSGLLAEFEEASKSRNTASDYLKQFDNVVLSQLDQEASDAIYRSAFTAGAAVAVVPHPSLDAAVALWRASTLVRKIGDIYGLEPTGLSSLRLLRHTVATAIIAAGADMATEAVVESVGEDAANRMFAVLSEGSIMAWRIYRLGNYAQKMCRPITS